MLIFGYFLGLCMDIVTYKSYQIHLEFVGKCDLNPLSKNKLETTI